MDKLTEFFGQIGKPTEVLALTDERPSAPKTGLTVRWQGGGPGEPYLYLDEKEVGPLDLTFHRGKWDIDEAVILRWAPIVFPEEFAKNPDIAQTKLLQAIAKSVYSASDADRPMRVTTDIEKLRAAEHARKAGESHAEYATYEFDPDIPSGQASFSLTGLCLDSSFRSLLLRARGPVQKSSPGPSIRS